MRIEKSIVATSAVALIASLMPAPASAQDIVMRRKMPTSIAATDPILPIDPRDLVAPCNPLTETCLADNAKYDYAWFASCGQKPPSMQCVRYSANPEALEVATEAECVTAKPTTGLLAQYITMIEGFSAGSKPTTVQLYAKCGFRDVYDKGWSVNCDTKATPVCIGYNTYTEDTQQLPDLSCAKTATSQEAEYARAAGLVPTGAKPNANRMCGSKAVPASYDGWRTYGGLGTKGLSGLGDPYVCNGRAGRIIRMACSYAGSPIASTSQECDYQTERFIAAQQGRSPAEFQNVGGGVVIESRYHGEDPLLFATCTWRKVPGAPRGEECAATNWQGSGGTYSVGNEGFVNRDDCSGGVYMIPTENVYRETWINFLGDSSSGLAGARSYCQATGATNDPNDPYGYADFTAYAPNACKTLPNPGANNHGQ